MKSLKTIVVSALVLFAVGAGAQTLDSTESFQNYKIVEPLTILVPTVIAVPMEGNLYANNIYLVREHETGVLVGSLFLKTSTEKQTKLIANSTTAARSSSGLVDENPLTTVDFEVVEDGQNMAEITLFTPTGASITATKLHTILASHVSLPLTVAIEARVNGAMRTVVATKRVSGSVVTFPKVTSNHWEITFTYAQPLRIAELVLQPDILPTDVTQELRFLAQPGSSYEVYFNSDTRVRSVTTEAGNLRNDEDVLLLGPQATRINPRYIPADIDSDGVRDVLDNCVSIANADQEDINGNGKGDACEDFDRDGRLNPQDNCPNDPNRNQADEDGDGIGDVCDQEESRFTERNAWVPWVGMGMAGLVLLSLFALVAVGVKKEDEIENKETEPESQA